MLSRRFASLLLLCAFACLGAGLLAAESAPPVREPAAVEAPRVAVTGRFEVVGGQRVLTLWGTPRERGFAQGYLLAESIVRGIERDFERVLKPLVPRYEALVRKMIVPQFAFAPRELAELEGLLEGLRAKLPPEQRVVKILKREFDLFDIKALNTFGDWYGLGCSSLAVWGKLTTDGRALVGRNFDFPGFEMLLRHQHVVVRAPEGGDEASAAHGLVGVSYPCSIGVLTGMSTAGVFVAVHDVRIKPSLDKAFRPNVPRLLAVRRLLEQTEGAKACLQALSLLRTWPTLYGNNLMVVAPVAAEGLPRAAVLEYDGRTDMDGGCTMRIVNNEAKDALPALCLACTNHHRGRATPEGYAERYKRWRFPVLTSPETALETPSAFDVTSLFAHVSKAAFPSKGVQRLATGLRGDARAHGTLHQAVGEPERRRLHLRFGRLGRHITQQPIRAYDVKALVGGATAPR